MLQTTTPPRYSYLPCVTATSPSLCLPVVMWVVLAHVLAIVNLMAIVPVFCFLPVVCFFMKFTSVADVAMLRTRA